MRWTRNKKPKEGDTKEKIRFAFFPIKIHDEWVWWEKYIVVYEYKKYYYSSDVVVEEGILFEKYYTEQVETIGWCKVNRKILIKI